MTDLQSNPAFSEPATNRPLSSLMRHYLHDETTNRGMNAVLCRAADAQIYDHVRQWSTQTAPADTSDSVVRALIPEAHISELSAQCGVSQIQLCKLLRRELPRAIRYYCVHLPQHP